MSNAVESKKPVYATALELTLAVAAKTDFNALPSGNNSATSKGMAAANYINNVFNGIVDNMLKHEKQPAKAPAKPSAPVGVAKPRA
ncbi:hypothetical protein [Metapseudomonas otitidis]|uniref:hypothetical protein n=1 Tax=Metapseudomonas otitidis TaxID=319939 RepID=UPI001AAF25EE|nr:hypothetical protein [Pseudomonas otitidis]MBO2926009.1 hypothetical protein [Pseudomonas otitidis]